MFVAALLEASGARNGAITIVNGRIVDLDNPKEHGAVYRLPAATNRLASVTEIVNHHAEQVCGSDS
jgi:hypothetical protein